MRFPRQLENIIVPPIKCQGIKTKLVSFISQNIDWDSNGVWYEPFLGSGVVLFNLRPQKAVVTDSNVHIIKVYQDIYTSKFDIEGFRLFLQEEGLLLKNNGEKHYYFIRDRFNHDPNNFDFLFLNRSCFNGLMRFNRHGKFNVPFGHKPERFRQAYITKIINQIYRIKEVMENKEWIFQAQDWRTTLRHVTKNDFVYLDPPYIGRYTDYYNQWNDNDAIKLAKWAKLTSSKFALSMWVKNRYRFNDHLNYYWNGNVLRTQKHFYHVGSKEKFRNSIVEGLVIKPGAAASNLNKYKARESVQIPLGISETMLPIDTTKLGVFNSSA